MAFYAVGYVNADIFSAKDLADKLIVIHGEYLLSVTEGILQQFKDLKTKGDFIMGLFDKDKKMLTEKRGLGEYELKICMSCKPDEKRNSCGECIHFQEAIDRLAAYEASGLTPKEVAKLIKKNKKAKSPSTIYEKITSMSVKELAAFIEGLDNEFPACSKEFCEDYQGDGHCTAHKTGGCIKATENWLNSKIEEGTK